MTDNLILTKEIFRRGIAIESIKKNGFWNAGYILYMLLLISNISDSITLIYLIKIIVVFGLQIGLQICLLDLPANWLARKTFKNKGLREFLGVRGGVWVIWTGWGWVWGVWGRKIL